MDTYVLILSILDATVRVATPLVFCALAGMFSERSGVIDIGLEGKMLMAAFVSAGVAAVYGSAWLGLGAGILVAMFMSLVHGFATITHKGDQVVSGVALNIIAAGLSVQLGIAWFQRGGQTPPIPDEARFLPIDLPLAGALSEIPIIGSFYAELVSGQVLLTYLAIVAVVIAWYVLNRTRFGLRLRAVGENPLAVDTAGISVVRMRYTAVLIGGLLCGMAGAYLTVANNGFFVRDMTAGRGYMALAALIFGKWRPVQAMMACLLFGFLDAVAIRLQGVEMPLIGEVPVQFIQALPYVLTVVLLAGFIGKAIAPKAIGRPFVKER